MTTAQLVISIIIIKYYTIWLLSVDIHSNFAWKISFLIDPIPVKVHFCQIRSFQTRNKQARTHLTKENSAEMNKENSRMMQPIWKRKTPGKMMQPIWNKQELNLYKLAGGSLKKTKYFSLRFLFSFCPRNNLGSTRHPLSNETCQKTMFFCIRVYFCDNMCFSNAGKQPPTL